MIVYKATNNINGKVYIGQTHHTLDVRKRRHEQSLYKNCRFYAAIRKYGKDAFSWEVLEECDSSEDVDKLEIFYINKFNSKNKEFGYNMTDGGYGPRGRRHTEEAKMKMSLAKKGKKLPHTPEWSRKIGESQRGFKNHMYGKVGQLNPLSKTYKITYPDGKVEIVKGLEHFCKNNSLHTGCMTRCATGERKQHKGFKCFYYEDK